MRALGRSGGESGSGDTTLPEVGGQELAGEETLDLAESWAEDEAHAGDHPGGAHRLLAALAILVAAGWSGFFVWANWAQMLAGAAPAQWASWVVSWAVPVALVGIGWLSLHMGWVPVQLCSTLHESCTQRQVTASVT